MGFVFLSKRPHRELSHRLPTMIGDCNPEEGPDWNQPCWLPDLKFLWLISLSALLQQLKWIRKHLTPELQNHLWHRFSQSLGTPYPQQEQLYFYCSG